MSKNMSVLITNNLITIAIHVCMCIIFLYPVGIVIDVGFNNMKFTWLALSICIIAVLFLYFWAGWKFLSSTNNAFLDVCSVILIANIVLAVTFIAYNSILERILRIPFYPIGSIIAYILKMSYETAKGEEWKSIYLSMSILPSLTMLIAIIIKRSWV